MSKLGDKYRLKVEDGKVKVECDEAKRIAKLPKNQQIPARKPKTRFAKPGEVSA